MENLTARTEYNNQASLYASMGIIHLAQLFMELPTFLKIAGDTRGKNCLDFACGNGVYTRMLSRLGARHVVGIDISSGMIDIAQSCPNPHGSKIEYLCSDLNDFKAYEKFDLVTGIYLLHYMQNKEALREVINAAYKNLNANGTFISFSISPNINRQKGYYEKYQVDFEFPDRVSDGSEFKFSLKTNPDNPLKFTCYYWSKEAIEDAFYSVGFKKIEWIAPAVSDYGKLIIGQEYWQSMLDNPWCMFIKALKD